ncbi:MAG: D-alanyl-D-alanine carboxypeptidase family protein [Gammaproteobacteria bacterium]
MSTASSTVSRSVSSRRSSGANAGLSLVSWSDGLQPWLRPYAEALVGHGRGVTVTSVFRSWTDQLRLWHTRERNPFPVAPPGYSYHQYGRAFDVIGPSSELAWLGRVWQSWGGTWSTSDPIHFQA